MTIGRSVNSISQPVPNSWQARTSRKLGPASKHRIHNAKQQAFATIFLHQLARVCLIGPRLMRWQSRQLAKRSAAAAAVAAVIAGGIATWIAVPPRIEQDKAGTAAVIDQALIEAGKYLATVGDCVACHTEQGGTPMAGGRALETPFGTVWSTNITPDLKTGSAAGHLALSTGPCARVCRATAIASTRLCPIPPLPRSANPTCARSGPISARGLLP